jgi:malic enzyme
MKTLKSIMLGAALLAVAGVANAAKPTKVPLTEDQVVNTYVDAMTQGNIDNISSVLADNAKFDLLETKGVVSYSKQEMVANFKENKGVQQDCITTSSVVENNPDNAVIEVDMKYNDHTRSNFVTVVNTDDGWKITNVYSIFK